MRLFSYVVTADRGRLVIVRRPPKDPGGQHLRDLLNIYNATANDHLVKRDEVLREIFQHIDPDNPERFLGERT